MTITESTTEPVTTPLAGRHRAREFTTQELTRVVEQWNNEGLADPKAVTAVHPPTPETTKANEPEPGWRSRHMADTTSEVMYAALFAEHGIADPSDTGDPGWLSYDERREHSSAKFYPATSVVRHRAKGRRVRPAQLVQPEQAEAEENDVYQVMQVDPSGAVRPPRSLVADLFSFLVSQVKKSPKTARKRLQGLVLWGIAVKSKAAYARVHPAIHPRGLAVRRSLAADAAKLCYYATYALGFYWAGVLTTLLTREHAVGLGEVLVAMGSVAGFSLLGVVFDLKAEPGNRVWPKLTARPSQDGTWLVHRGEDE